MLVLFRFLGILPTATGAGAQTQFTLLCDTQYSFLSTWNHGTMFHVKFESLFVHLQFELITSQKHCINPLECLVFHLSRVLYLFVAMKIRVENDAIEYGERFVAKFEILHSVDCIPTLFDLCQMLCHFPLCQVWNMCFYLTNRT